MEERQKHDFDDGRGPVFAHQHPTGGGWVEDGCYVREETYLGPNAVVFSDEDGSSTVPISLAYPNIRLAEDARIHPSSMRGVLTENPVPVIENIDAKILKMVELDTRLFQMKNWHTNACLFDEDGTKYRCETAHCRAGWATTLAGKAGKALEGEVGPWIAGGLIYQASRPGFPIPDFFCSEEEALADLKRSAQIHEAMSLADSSPSVKEEEKEEEKEVKEEVAIS